MAPTTAGASRRARPPVRPFTEYTERMAIAPYENGVACRLPPKSTGTTVPEDTLLASESFRDAGPKASHWTNSGRTWLRRSRARLSRSPRAHRRSVCRIWGRRSGPSALRFFRRFDLRCHASRGVGARCREGVRPAGLEGPPPARPPGLSHEGGFAGPLIGLAAPRAEPRPLTGSDPRVRVVGRRIRQAPLTAAPPARLGPLSHGC